jgi:phage gp36-like protein
MSSYATPTDLSNLALPSGAIPAFQTTAIQQAHLDAASDTVDSYIADQCTLPLIAPFPASIKMRVCQIAAYTLLIARGYNPDNGPDELMKMQHDGAMEWLEKVAAGKIRPPLNDSSPGGIVGGPNVQQASVQGGSSQASVGGPTNIINGGTVVLGPPSLRGWNGSR